MKNSYILVEQYHRQQKMVRNRYLAIAGVALLSLLLLPALGNNYLNHVLIQILLFSYLGQSWNIMCGYSGQMSFGHAAFYGIGAYASTLLFLNLGISPWIGMFCGGLIAAVVGLAIGGITLRYGLQSAYFAFFTLTSAEIIRLIALGWSSLTQGAEGLMLPLSPGDSLNFMFSVHDKHVYYYIILVMYVLVTLIAARIKRTRLGYQLAAVKGEESAALMLGINAYRVKMTVFGLSAFLTALGGTFYAQYFQHFDPEVVLDPMRSFEIIFPVIIGGGSSVFGSAVGSLVLQGSEEITRTIMPADLFGVHRVVYGLLVVGMLMYLPQGLMGAFDKWLRARVRAKDAANNPLETNTPGEGAHPVPMR